MRVSRLVATVSPGLREKLHTHFSPPRFGDDTVDMPVPDQTLRFRLSQNNFLCWNRGEFGSEKVGLRMARLA